MALAPKRYRRDFRAVGDLYGPFFRVALLNTTGDATEIEGFAAGRIGTDLVRNDARAAASANAVSAIFSLGFGFQFSASDFGSPRKAGEPLTPIEDLTLKINASLTCTSKAGSPFRFVLTMTPEYDDALKLLNSNLLGYATIARVQWGYVTEDGEILTENHLFRNILPKAKFGEHIQIIVEGVDMISDVAMRRSSRTAYGPPKSKYDVIADVVNRITGFTIADKATTQNEIGAKHELFDPIKKEIIQTTTDWAFVITTLRGVGLTFSIANNEFKIYDPVRPPASQQQSYFFKWRLQLTGPFDIPVYSIDANYLPNMFQPPAARGLVAMKYNAESGDTGAVKLDAEDVDSEAPAGATTPAGETGVINTFAPPPGPPENTYDALGNPITVEAAVTETTVGTRQSIPPEDSKSGDPSSFSLAVVKEAMFRSHPMVKLKCPGVPDMFPGLIVDLAGASVVFDGKYTVLEVKHSVTSSGYDMDVTLIRWVQKQKKSPKDAPKANTAAKPATDGSTGSKPVKNPGDPLNNFGD